MNIDIIENDEALRAKTRPLIFAIKHVNYQIRELSSFKMLLWFLIAVKGRKLIP